MNSLVSKCKLFSTLLVPVAAQAGSETPKHGVQRRMISVVNYFVFLRLLFFAVLLLHVT